MKSLRINAKSAPLTKQIEAKVNTGFKNIEIQLIHDYVSEIEYAETKDAIEKMGIDISVVHTPLVEIGDDIMTDISLDGLLINKNCEILDDTCKFAQYLTELLNHRIKVVIHNDFSKEIWMETKLLEEKIIPRIKEILDKYSDVDLLIENSSSYGTGKANYRSIGNMDDVSYAVKVLNNAFENRVETLIDTCHMLMNWEAWKKTTGSIEKFSNWDIEFKNATQYSELGLIHLNNMKENGLGKNHGVAFNKDNKEDMQELEQIMNAYEKYANCEITIEVRENNYEGNPEQLILTKEALEELRII